MHGNLEVMNDQITSVAEQKRPVLHKLIDDLPAEELELVERVLARLEMDRLWNEVRDGFTADWENGKYAGLDDIIRQVRGDLKQQAA